jgi:hypothetical protein
MRILDKYKDFYDYFSGIYGIDNTVFFDRRGSVPLNQHTLIHSMMSFRHINYEYDIDDHGHFRDIYCVVEAGYFQYLIKISNIITKKSTSDCDFTLDTYSNPCQYDGEFELVHVFDDNKHYFTSPINLYSVDFFYNFSLSKFKQKKQAINYSNDIKTYEESLIEKPIFTNTKIPSILDARTIYINIFDYLSSKADFNITDTRDDVSKAVDHGFDKKTSFRRM